LFLIFRSFSTEALRAASSIHDTFFKLSSKAFSIPSIICFATCLPWSPKLVAAKVRPTASPSARSVAITQRRHRGASCFWPVRTRFMLKSSSTNSFPRVGAAAWTTRQRM